MKQITLKDKKQASVWIFCCRFSAVSSLKLKQKPINKRPPTLSKNAAVHCGMQSKKPIKEIRLQKALALK